MQHWDPDSEKTPPWSIEEQNELAHDIDKDVVSIALELYWEGHSNRTNKTYAEFVRTMSLAQKQMLKWAKKRGKPKSRDNDLIELG